MTSRVFLAATFAFAAACTPEPAAHTHTDGAHTGHDAHGEHAAAATAATATTPPADHAKHGAAGQPAAAGYTCPMDPEVRSTTPGTCPKCGMDLVAVNPAMTNKTFDVIVTTTPAPEAGKKTTVGFEVVDDGKQRVKDFDVVHEKKLHLLMVSGDLSWFAHEHPELKPDGTMTLDFTFPAGGPHALYADFRPTGAPGQVIRKPLDVKGAPRPIVALQKDDLSKAKTIAGHQVRMKASSLAAGDNVKLDFLLVKDGKPVTTLTPYLGAMGHCVIISQDGSKFLHSHPDEGAAHDHAPGTKPHADTPSPGQVSFATQFPEPGLYKVWGQFLHGTEMIIADFVVDVGPASGKPAAAAHGEHKH